MTRQEVLENYFPAGDNLDIPNKELDKQRDLALYCVEAAERNAALKDKARKEVGPKFARFI